MYFNVFQVLWLKLSFSLFKYLSLLVLLLLLLVVVCLTAFELAAVSSVTQSSNKLSSCWFNSLLFQNSEDPVLRLVALFVLGRLLMPVQLYTGERKKCTGREVAYSDGTMKWISATHATYSSWLFPLLFVTGEADFFKHFVLKMFFLSCCVCWNLL